MSIRKYLVYRGRYSRWRDPDAEHYYAAIRRRQPEHDGCTCSECEHHVGLIWDAKGETCILNGTIVAYSPYPGGQDMVAIEMFLELIGFDLLYKLDQFIESLDRRGLSATQIVVENS